MTPSEKFVSELCEKSFLPFWSFPSPLGKKNKELCDVLVVCENSIIIISIKDIKVSEHSDENIRYERWQKKAILSSIDQIYGAERFLKNGNEITLSDKITKIQLPPHPNREIFRIAIAFGGKKEYPLETGEFGSGFVHVFDEQSTFTVLSELDTITDFVNYLKAKEKFLANKTIMVPREIDFLALYLKTTLEFDFIPDTVVLDEGMWEDYLEDDEYKYWQKEIPQSYVWDEIVSQLHAIHIKDKKDYTLVSDLERATRIIALEPRINRIELGMCLIDAIEKKVRGRMMPPLDGSDHSYVFMPLSYKNWESKEKELQLRCLVARKESKNAPKVIGIAIGKSSTNEHIFDIAYFDIPELNEEMLEKIEEAKQELGYFKNPTISRSKDMRK
ncbi:MAG: hypothetical protein AB2L24_10435 [Mangrovibacterium sp.]